MYTPRNKNKTHHRLGWGRLIDAIRHARQRSRRPLRSDCFVGTTVLRASALSYRRGLLQSRSTSLLLRSRSTCYFSGVDLATLRCMVAPLRCRSNPYCFAPDGADVGSSGCKPRETKIKHTIAPDGAGLSTRLATRDNVHVDSSGVIVLLGRRFSGLPP